MVIPALPENACPRAQFSEAVQSDTQHAPISLIFNTLPVPHEWHSWLKRSMLWSRERCAE